MLKYTGNFRECIKDNVRDIKAAISFTNGNEIIVVSDDITDISYLSSIKKEMGDVVLKALDIKLRETEITKLLKEDMMIQLSYICEGECEVDLFYIDSLNTKSDTITLQAYDMLTWLNNKCNKVLPLDRDVLLGDYIRSVLTSIGVKSMVHENIANPKLSVAWPKSTNLLVTFRELAIASNSLIRFGKTSLYGAYLPFTLPKVLNERIVGAEVSKLIFTNSVESIDSWIDDIEIKKDGSNKYNDVRVPLYSPYLLSDRKIGTMRALIPHNVNHYCPGTAELDSTFIPSLIKIDKRIELDDIAIGNNTVNLYFNNNSPLAKEINVELYGSSIENTSILSADTSNTSKIKVVNNMYIQSAAVYNTDIYKCSDVEFSYFGNPLIEVGDTVSIDGMDVLVLEHSLKYDGGLRGTVKGVLRCS